MTKLGDLISLESGTSQFRLTESLSNEAPVYRIFGQAELDADLMGLDAFPCDERSIRTHDRVCVLQSGDVVFSLLTGKAAIVGPVHDGCIFTQNHVRMIPESLIDSGYLAYLLNESSDVRRQLLVGQQGSSMTQRYTVKQLSELELGTLPSLEMQRTLGQLYFNQLKLNALKKRQADLETVLVLGKIKGVQPQ